LQEIYWIKLTLDLTLDRAETKRQIIQNSIYGVDIDAGAIEIARLRFWLALWLVSKMSIPFQRPFQPLAALLHSGQTYGYTRSLAPCQEHKCLAELASTFSKRAIVVDEEVPGPLPNLDYKIMQGNSLLESFEGIPLDNLTDEQQVSVHVFGSNQDELNLGGIGNEFRIEVDEERRLNIIALMDRYFSETNPEEKTRTHAEIDRFVLDHIDHNIALHKDRLEIELQQLRVSIKSPEVMRLLKKLQSTGTTLGNYVDGKFYRGVLTGLNEAFVVDRATRDRLIDQDPRSEEILVPFLRGRDIKRWRVDFAEYYLIKIESSENNTHRWTGKADAEEIFKKTYSAIYAWMRLFRDRLISRWDQGKHFWELRSCVYYNDFKTSKILYPDIYEHQSYCYDESGYFSVNTTYFIRTDEKWLTGLLNSNLPDQRQATGDQ
jgi:hypothetical protein